MKDYVILQNQAECLLCGDRPYSAHVHDFKECKCGEIFVDGGQVYFRGGFKNRKNFKDISVSVNRELYNDMEEALIWAKDNKRNELGAICAVFRAIRDNGYKLTKVEEDGKEME